ncbi:leucine-rich_repeat domain-containing protein [Hexamita inflata]|uniref:Leucine-rich repeat domain-containing protein n=1 Tax=Hexamita inflata TaxID=28002 RepID=A0AA86TMT1_9EUKA|nr:leucine-rich repeat domain-containing protein [Hexamita inflata]
MLSDIAPLKYLIELEYLDISYNNIVCINALKNATNLQTFKARSNQIINIPLEKLVKLEFLDLSLNSICDVTPLFTMQNLKYLNLFSNKVIELTALSHLQSLEHLDLFNNQVIYITPLYELNSLIYLNLNTNWIVSPYWSQTYVDPIYHKRIYNLNYQYQYQKAPLKNQICLYQKIQVISSNFITLKKINNRNLNNQVKLMKDKINQYVFDIYSTMNHLLTKCQTYFELNSNDQ